MTLSHYLELENVVELWVEVVLVGLCLGVLVLCVDLGSVVPNEVDLGVGVGLAHQVLVGQVLHTRNIFLQCTDSKKSGEN